MARASDDAPTTHTAPRASQVGFLTVFLTPVPLARTPFPAEVPPPPLVLWLLRWCAFRLMLGAGMSKLGGNASACWRALACTTTHYATQPMPNPLAWLAHRAPLPLHQVRARIVVSRWCSDR